MIEMMPLSNEERRVLASQLCRQLRWDLRAPQIHTRLDNVIKATRILEILKSIPEETDSA